MDPVFDIQLYDRKNLRSAMSTHLKNRWVKSLTIWSKMKTFCKMIKILKSSFKFPLVVISHTTRMLPQRAWAASIPTLLSHDAFDTLLTPNRPQGLPYTVSLSPLERFLGSVYLRRNLPRLIQSESVSHDLLSTESIHHWKVFMKQQ